MLFDNNATTIDVYYAIESRYLKEDILFLDLATIKDFIKILTIL